jgi:hypothetical protein
VSVLVIAGEEKLILGTDYGHGDKSSTPSRDSKLWKASAKR